MLYWLYAIAGPETPLFLVVLCFVLNSHISGFIAALSGCF